MDEWLQGKDARELSSHARCSTFHRFAVAHNVLTKPHPKHPRWNLYSRMDILRAVGERDERKITCGELNQPPLRKFNTYPKLKGDHVIIADAHCPFVDWEFFEQALRIKDKLKIGKLLLGGDTLDCAALSRFPKLFRVSWQTEKEEARKFLKACAQEFDEVTCITGNHEMRYLLKLWVTYEDDILESGRTDIWEIATANMDKELKNKIRFSIYPFATINGEGIDGWRVVHPATCRKQPLSLARELSGLYMQSIIVTHAHMSGWCYAPNIKLRLFDCGVFADPLSFDYKNLRVTAHYEWSETFITITDNKGRIWEKGDDWPVVM